MPTYGIMNEQTPKVSEEVMPCLKARDKGCGMQVVMAKGDKLQAPGQTSLFDLDLWCGKTSPELSAVSEEKISAPYSKKRQGLKTITPLYLDLREGSGLMQEPLWEAGGALLGAYSTRNFGAYPSAAVESSLSQILEDNPHRKYYLSARACAGILRRAEKRGKELPPMLKEALEMQAGGGVVYCLQGNGIDRADTAGCNGAGWREDVSYTLNTIDRPAVAVMPFDTTQITSPQNGNRHEYCDPCHPLCSAAHAPAVVVAGFKGKASPAAGNIGYEVDNAPTLVSGQEAHVLCQHEYGEYRYGIGTLKANCGDPSNSGGNVVVMAHGQANAEITEDVCPTLNCNHEQPIVGAFQNTGRGWWNESDVAQCLRTPGGGDSTKANLIAGVDCRNYRETEEFRTLQAKERGGTSLNYSGAVRTGYAVRRLTPLECDRLMGYPDNWTLIPGASDTARYKADGNSVAIPCVEYVAEGIAEILRGM